MILNKPKTEVPALFSPGLFWDVNDLSLEQHKDFIISRVLNEGQADDVRKLWQFYSERDIIHLVKNRRSLNARTAYFWCYYFKIPVEQCQSLQMQLPQK
jgi:hypothetical protein